MTVLWDRDFGIDCAPPPAHKCTAERGRRKTDSGLCVLGFARLEHEQITPLHTGALIASFPCAAPVRCGASSDTCQLRSVRAVLRQPTSPCGQSVETESVEARQASTKRKKFVRSDRRKPCT